jgi:hypothetical protein
MGLGVTPQMLRGKRFVRVHDGVWRYLPAPASNVGAVAADDQTRIGDLVYRRWGVVVEYEGEHHQLDRAQYVKDIDRYASLRRDAVPYVQVTKEKLERPRQLFAPLSDVVAAQRRCVRVGSARSHLR